MIINDLSSQLTQTAQVRRVTVGSDGTIEKSETGLVCEHRMDVYVNEKLALRIACTPSELAFLTVGRMISEGYVSCVDDIENVYICEYGSRAKVYIKNSEMKETVLTEATCCTDNRVLMENAAGKLPHRLSYAPYKQEWIFALAEKFSEDSHIHKSTGGTHSCYLSYDGEFVYSAEDIGRHNAVDKCIGYAAVNNLDFSKCILFSTGRIPVDMVRKAVFAGIPVLASKSVPTYEAVMMAKEYNLTLICRAWPDKYDVYAAAEQEKAD